MSLMDTLRKTSKGAAVITDWLGAGGNPVSLEQADRRARSCIGCPNNVSPNWWNKTTGSIAAAMRDMLAIKNDCQMHIAVEDKLHVCRACGCCLPCKIWVPIVHISKMLDKQTVLDLPSHCWMKQEICEGTSL